MIVDTVSVSQEMIITILLLIRGRNLVSWHTHWDKLCPPLLCVVPISRKVTPHISSQVVWHICHVWYAIHQSTTINLWLFVVSYFSCLSPHSGVIQETPVVGHFSLSLTEINESSNWKISKDARALLARVPPYLCLPPPLVCQNKTKSIFARLLSKLHFSLSFSLKWHTKVFLFLF